MEELSASDAAADMARDGGNATRHGRDEERIAGIDDPGRHSRG